MTREHAALEARAAPADISRAAVDGDEDLEGGASVLAGSEPLKRTRAGSAVNGQMPYGDRGQMDACEHEGISASLSQPPPRSPAAPAGDSSGGDAPQASEHVPAIFYL